MSPSCCVSPAQEDKAGGCWICSHGSAVLSSHGLSSMGRSLSRNVKANKRHKNEAKSLDLGKGLFPRRKSSQQESKEPLRCSGAAWQSSLIQIFWTAFAVRQPEQRRPQTICGCESLEKSGAAMDEHCHHPLKLQGTQKKGDYKVHSQPSSRLLSSSKPGQTTFQV